MRRPDLEGGELLPEVRVLAVAPEGRGGEAGRGKRGGERGSFRGRRDEAGGHSDHPAENELAKIAEIVPEFTCIY